MKTDIIAYIILSATMVIWGTTDPLGKWMVRASIGPTIPPLMIALMRYLLATIIFLIFLKFHEHTLHFDFAKKHFGILILMGLLTVSLYQISYLYGLDYTAASDASLILSFAPIYVLLLTVIVFKEPLTSNKLLGVLLGTIGVIIIISFSPNVHEPNRLLGDGLIIISMISYASYGVVVQYLMKGYEKENLPKPSTITITTWVSVFGLVTTIPAMIVLSPSYLTNFNLYLVIPVRIWLGIIYLVLFATILANVMLVKGVSLIKASRTAIFANLIPITAIFLSALFLHEKISPIVDFLSFFLIVIGILLVNRNKEQMVDELLSTNEAGLTQI